MKKKNPDGCKGTVYSTEHGRICPSCSRPVSRCVCRDEEEPVETDGVVRVFKETKGRKGKCVTVVAGLPLRSGELKDLARKLKKKCGAGGTARNGVIEIQGDFCDLVREELDRLDGSPGE